MIENTAYLSTVPITVHARLGVLKGRVRHAHQESSAWWALQSGAHGAARLFTQTVAMAMLFAPERRLRTPVRMSHQGTR